jgi:hypothetical protein
LDARQTVHSTDFLFQTFKNNIHLAAQSLSEVGGEELSRWVSVLAKVKRGKRGRDGAGFPSIYENQNPIKIRKRGEGGSPYPAPSYSIPPSPSPLPFPTFLVKVKKELSTYSKN